MRIRLEHLPADLFGLSDTARRALSGRPNPAGFAGLCIPARPEDIDPPHERFEPEERAHLALTLEENLARFEPPVAVLDAARSLGKLGASAVLTSAAPRLAGGSLANLMRALQVVRLARTLSARWEQPVVPVFWNDADDHDCAAAGRLDWLNENLDVQRIGLAGLPSEPRPIGELILCEATHQLEAVHQRLVASGLPARGAFLPRKGESLATGFTRTLLALCGHLGLVVVEPAWLRPELSRSLAGWIDGWKDGELDERRADTRAVCFRHAAGRRLALHAGGEGFRYADEPGSRTRAELVAEIIQDPSTWSAGARLLPLVRESVLPVAAFVGDLGELEDWAGVLAARARANLPATPFVPRISATLVDPACRRSLERSGHELAQVLSARTTDEPREAEPASKRTTLADELREVAASASSELRGRGKRLAELDPGLARQLARTAKRMRELVDRLAVKAERVAANRSGKERRHLRRLRNVLTPLGGPQDATLSLLQAVSRHGTAWIDTLADQLDPLGIEHLVVHLESEDPSRPS